MSGENVLYLVNVAPSSWSGPYLLKVACWTCDPYPLKVADPSKPNPQRVHPMVILLVIGLAIQGIIYKRDNP